MPREASNAGQSVAEIEAAVQAEQTAKLLDRRTSEVAAEREAVQRLQKCALVRGATGDEFPVKIPVLSLLFPRMQTRVAVGQLSAWLA